MTRSLLALVMLVTATACAGGSTGGEPSANSDGSVQQTEPAAPTLPAGASDASTGSNQRAEFLATASGPVGLTTDSTGRIWVAHADAGTVTRLSAGGTAVDLRRVVGQAPLRLAATSGSIWVTVFGDGKLVRLDERTGKVQDRIAIGATPEGITVDGRSLLVVLEDSGEVVRYDVRRGRVTDRYRVGPGPRLVEVAGTSAWVTRYSEGLLTRIDLTTGEITDSKFLCAGPQGMLVRAGTVWVACTLGNTLIGVDAQTLRVRGELALPGSPDAVTAGPAGRLLVALQKGPTLAVVDAAGPDLVRSHVLGSVDQLYDRANIDALLVDGTAMVSSYLEGGVYRLPLR